MWFSSLKGVHNQSKHNFVTACIGGIFLASQRKIHNLRLTTTESIEHAFGTARSWRREFSINEFIIYCNKIDFIMKNVLQFDLKTSTTKKGYMHGFQGFANVVKNINQKLSKNNYERELDAWAVDIDYTSTIPVIDQINNKVISAIKRIQGPVLNLMRVFGMEDISSYCGSIDKISDICSIYCSTSKIKYYKMSSTNVISEKDEHVEEELLQRLSNLALDFNSGNGTNNLSCEPIDASTIINNAMQKDNSSLEEFDCESFFRFVSQDIRNNNVGKMLHFMSESMSTSFETRKVHGSITKLQKIQSLEGRWFKVRLEDVEQIITGNSVERNCIYSKDGKFYRVLSVFKKSYNKWRHERQGDRNEKLKVHLQELEIFHDYYQAELTYNYVCEDSTNLGTYLGHAFNING